MRIHITYLVIQLRSFNLIISTIISVGLCEFLGRAFESAKPDEEKKVFNYETHTYDSEKNGRLDEKGNRTLIVEKKTSNGKSTKLKATAGKGGQTNAKKV